jgi:integrase
MVHRFAKEDLDVAPIGEAWRLRIQHELLRTPSLLRRAGISIPPSSPGRLRAEHVEGLKRALPWSPATFTIHFVALRRFLRWAKNPLGDQRGIWSVPTQTSSRRRWLTPEQLVRLYQAARDRERILVALEGFNGLRRVEVLRLRSKDIDFDRQRLHVLGKGRNGGKWRTLPMFSETERALRSLSPAPDENTRVIPLSKSGADLILHRAVVRAGFPELGIRVSHHDLRRTFGRTAHKAGMDLVQIKNLYGHNSLDQTVHYIGLDEDEMRVGLGRMAALLDPMLQLDPASPGPLLGSPSA